MRIEVICTGDEVLTGKTVNTNFAHITQKLEEVGLAVKWETTVGDERDELLLAFQLAGGRADAVIVNGGLGPTVDDLSQEIAARAAGVELVLNEAWLARMEAYFARRSRAMPPTNRKQAMLPAGAELLDNPIGTACGFALDIGRAHFYFTPGVPRELRCMLESEIVPRLLARQGAASAIHLKRFHCFGIGESRADALLAGTADGVPDGTVKLGFRAHYPQLEVKLAARGRDMDDIGHKLAPVEAAVRRRLGNHVVAEDERTLEGVVLEALAAHAATLCTVEMFTGGQLAARLAHLPGAARILRRGTVAPELDEAFAAVGLERAAAGERVTLASSLAVARAARRQAGTTHALAVLVALDEGAERADFAGTVCLAIAAADVVVTRRAHLVGGRDWVRLGAVELALDCLRRHLQGLPVAERIDFETIDDR
ncbi:MAG: CinA family nicotinamide mononucleotide deamidase-related protein [Burkholderiales bacterium]|nr:CinA family nicotinamide mononucleotide deamidase-related protein [Burkholderiales bacterium]